MTFSAPIWSSGFRPFFLSGAIYGPLVMLSWLLAYSGEAAPFGAGIPANLWHGHELLAGYGIAVITGFIITGVPSWAETGAVVKGRLALLWLTWLAGRIAMWLMPSLPAEVIAGLDMLYYVTLIVLVWQTLRGDLKYPSFRLLIPILFLFLYGNALFHWGLIGGDFARATFGVQFYLYVIVILYTLVGGFLTPIFTENELFETKGWQTRITFDPVIEGLSAVSVLVFAWTGLYAPDTIWAAVSGVVCFAAHAVRFARWRGWKVIDVPLLWVMNLSYIWFLIFVALRTVGDFGGPVPQMTHIHAFTIGAFGLMKIGFLTRVVLRHTGRPLKPAGLMVFGFGLMLVAAVLRLLASYGIAVYSLMGLSAAFWIAPFLFYLILYGSYLIGPSLPYEPERRARIVESTPG